MRTNMRVQKRLIACYQCKHDIGEKGFKVEDAKAFCVKKEGPVLDQIKVGSVDLGTSNKINRKYGEGFNRRVWRMLT
jgi:hypothetical protein